MTSNILELVRLFKDDDGSPLRLYTAQEKIFEAIVLKTPRRIPVITPTQYGKSLACAIGAITRSCTMGEKWLIIGATEKKARIIMDYVLKHIFDNALFYSQLTTNTPLERIKNERSKDRITWRKGGEIYILSAQARVQKNMKDALLGFGAPNIILDDSPLIPDELYAMVKRMLGGKKDNFLLETGNPIHRNHFYKTWQAAKEKIFWDCYMAVKEGRFEQAYIDEMAEQMFFKVLYECKFPAADEMDEAGWSPLLSMEEVDAARERRTEADGAKRLGVDVGRGGDATTFIIREGNYARIKHSDHIRDIMAVVGNTQRIMEEEGIPASEVFMDEDGVGGGAVDRLKEQKVYINGVMAGREAEKEFKFENGKRVYFSRYMNKRAEMNWKMREWIKRGGALEPSDKWDDMADNRWRVNSTGKVQLMSKELLKMQGIDSPNFSDGLALTFAETQAQVTKGSFEFASAGNVDTAGLGDFSMRNF